MTSPTQPLRSFGWIPDRPDHRDYLFAAQGAIVKALPPKVDLRAQCPPIYDQGQLGSCTANAIAGIFEFERVKQNLNDFMPSRLFIYYNERVIEHTVRSDAGAMLRDGIKTVAKQGVCPESEWKYNLAKFASKPTAKCYKDALKAKVLTYQRITHDINQMKGCLAQGNPFVFGIAIYDNFPMNTATGDIPMPGNASGTNEGHAMACVGYDDATRLFFIRNSWGTSWGASGYGTIPYEYLIRPDLSDDFWTIQSEL